MISRNGRIYCLAFFLITYHKIWSFGWDYMIHLYLKISEMFMRLIFKNGFWIVYKVFARMVKFYLLTQFPRSAVPYSVVSRLIVFIYLLTSFTYYVINRLLSITTKLTSVILLCFIYVCFDIVLMKLFFVFPCKISLVCRLKCQYSCFLPAFAFFFF